MFYKMPALGNVTGILFMIGGVLRCVSFPAMGHPFRDLAVGAIVFFFGLMLFFSPKTASFRKIAYTICAFLIVICMINALEIAMYVREYASSSDYYSQAYAVSLLPGILYWFALASLVVSCILSPCWKNHRYLGGYCAGIAFFILMAYFCRYLGEELFLHTSSDWEPVIGFSTALGFFFSSVSITAGFLCFSMTETDMVPQEKNAVLWESVSDTLRGKRLLKVTGICSVIIGVISLLKSFILMEGGLLVISGALKYDGIFYEILGPSSVISGLWSGMSAFFYFMAGIYGVRYCGDGKKSLHCFAVGMILCFLSFIEILFAFFTSGKGIAGAGALFVISLCYMLGGKKNKKKES